MVGNIDNFFNRLDLLSHIVVLVVHIQKNTLYPIRLPEFLDQDLDRRFAFLKLRTVKVTNDVGQGCRFHVAMHRQQVIKAFVAFRELGRFAGRQAAVELHRDFGRIDHLPFRSTRVDVVAFEGDFGGCCIKALILKLP
ncbi:hypothetical protein D3C81_878780 [compost metagenome]